jgi:glycosyltransferase involved in cell wall biosynthesis
VIVERFWRGGVRIAELQQLVAEIRRSGARFFYALDDNLFDLREGLVGADLWFTDEHLEMLEWMSREADGVLVSTEPLRQRVLRYNRNVVVLPNALDERLLVKTLRQAEDTPFDSRRIVIGYMGTKNHDEDMELIAPALHHLHRCYPGRIELQIVGVIAREGSLKALHGLPYRVITPPPGADDYPLFMPWFTSTMRWDIAVAPLRDSAYNRCKSDIKLLDYAAVCAAGVYSRIAPYESLPEGTGLLADSTPESWTQALEQLVRHPELRRAIAAAARRYVTQERTLRQCAPQWPRAIEALFAAAPNPAP